LGEKVIHGLVVVPSKSWPGAFTRVGSVLGWWGGDADDSNDEDESSVGLTAPKSSADAILVPMANLEREQIRGRMQARRGEIFERLERQSFTLV
jgi:hypothetical protein